MEEYAVQMRGIYKQYPLVTAVNGADFTVRKGEVVSLLGENGAGKSTLMKILYGMTQPTSGEIYINGRQEKIQNPTKAMSLGIGMVHQHFMLVPVLSITENAIIGTEPQRNGFINLKQAYQQVQAWIDKLDFKLDATQLVGTLSLGEQQRVEILKALYHGAEVLILDEPTAVLTPQEVEELFGVIRTLKAEGKSVVLITHKLKETLAIADRIAVLRDGVMVEQDVAVEHATLESLANLMVGRDVNLAISRRTQCKGAPHFEVKHVNLTQKGKQILTDLSFTVSKGEILGIAGIEGNGQTELIEVLTGLRKADSAEIYVEGKPIQGDARVFLNHKIGHVPEDRSTRGLILDMTLSENIILGYHKKDEFAGKVFLKQTAIKTYSQEKMDSFSVKTPSEQVLCNALSGGNQQKVVIARVFSQDPEVIIVAQPTRGVDVGAQEYIHNKLLSLRDEGKAILLISADLDEVRSLSDRIAVMYDGKIVSFEDPDIVTETQLGMMMAGSLAGKDGVR